MKTDNSHFDVKVQLRVCSLPQKKEIYVLDCFSGTGKIWKEVCRRESEKNIHVISIEKEEGKNRYAITGDNIKVLSAFVSLWYRTHYGMFYRQKKLFLL